MRRRTDREPQCERLVVTRCDAPDVLDMRAPPATAPAPTSWVDLAPLPRRGPRDVYTFGACWRPQAEWAGSTVSMRADAFADLIQWASTRPSRRANKEATPRHAPRDASAEAGPAALACYRQDVQPQTVVVLAGVYRARNVRVIVPRPKEHDIRPARATCRIECCGWALSVERRGPGGRAGQVVSWQCRDLGDLDNAARALFGQAKTWGLPVRLAVADDLAGSDACRLLVRIASAALIAPPAPIDHRMPLVPRVQAAKSRSNLAKWPTRSVPARNASGQYLWHSRRLQTI